MSMFRAAVLLGVLSVFGSVGCADKEIIDPVVEIPEKRSVVVVPFRDEMFANGFDSPRGCELAGKIAKLLRDKAEFRVKPMEVVLKLYDEDNPKTLTAREVAEKTKADYVLMGHVTHWASQDSKTYGGLLRGSATIEVTLYETAAAAAEREEKKEKKDEDQDLKGSGRFAMKRSVRAIYPQEFGMGGIGTYEMTKEQIESGLLNTSAQSVAWLLIAHTKEEERLANAQ